MKICPKSSDFLIPLTADSSLDHERSVSYNVVIFHLRLLSLQSDDNCSQFIIAMLLRSKGIYEVLPINGSRLLTMSVT